MNRHFGPPYQLSRYSEEYHAGADDSGSFPAVWGGSGYETGLPWTKTPASTWPIAGQWKTGCPDYLVSASGNGRTKFAIRHEETPLPPAITWELPGVTGRPKQRGIHLVSMKVRTDTTLISSDAVLPIFGLFAQNRSSSNSTPAGSERFLCSWVPAMSRSPGGSIDLATTSFPFWIRPPYH